jgi:RNA polymerase sigma factor (sigma-70 family)
VAPHLHLLYRAALRMTQQEQAAEDLLQDTLERAFLNFARYEPGTNIRAWLLRIMSNVRISGFRRVSRRPQTSSLDELEAFSIYGAARAEVERHIAACPGCEDHFAFDGIVLRFVWRRSPRACRAGSPGAAACAVPSPRRPGAVTTHSDGSVPAPRGC